MPLHHIILQQTTRKKSARFGVPRPEVTRLLDRGNIVLNRFTMAFSIVLYRRYPYNHFPLECENGYRRHAFVLVVFHKEEQPMAGVSSTDHHTKAAEHHEMAAKHHRAAAEAHSKGDVATAAHHAHLAHGHHSHATHHMEEAAKKHTEHPAAPKPA